ncbi:MAG: hypothetical protein PHO90_03200 [Candidatus Pacebacteria bacterium]|nr:hypothetical protein [Candidatus Paceibacterota bacterium]
MLNFDNKLFRGILIVLVSGIFVVLMAQNIFAEEPPLSCTITSGECAGVTVFKMQALGNSHAELSSQSNYSYKVCCTGADIGNTCADNFAVVLNLSGQTNAHVEENGYSNYAEHACLSYAQAEGIIACANASDCATLGEGYVCLASISGETNAHVGDCSAYADKVCCQVTAPPSSWYLPIWREVP